MARPVKQGLDYYPMDVNILSDVKMRRIIKYFGAESIAVILSVLCMIYADEGYYLACNNDLSFLISEFFNSIFFPFGRITRSLFTSKSSF